MCSLRRALRNGSCSSWPLLLMFCLVFMVFLSIVLYSLFRRCAMQLASPAGTPCVGIRPRPQLHPQRGALQFESLPEESFQVAPVGVRYSIEGIAVDHDAWRVDAALMGIARPGPDHPGPRRLLLRDGLREDAGQARRRQARHPRGVSLIHRLQ